MSNMAKRKTPLAQIPGSEPQPVRNEDGERTYRTARGGGPAGHPVGGPAPPPPRPPPGPRGGVPGVRGPGPGPLGRADWKRVRLHSYWTERILRRCPGLTDLAELAAGHHERLDGSGYPQGKQDTSPASRLLAAADVFAACTEARPYRPAARPAEAAALLGAEVTAGHLDGDACAAVIAAAGDRPGHAAHGLSDTEVDVLRLTARGRSGREIAAVLLLPERTVTHHLTELRGKTGQHTRAGAAVFAMSHQLLPG
ncbi:HD domain-containing phosphohydrolase [Nocardia abscessus]|uniref:HD domain-containing phosphohydrolase n=1 Tax=Nocardia abscessus TaxID=120957 RepID=UPI00245477B6|nr:HD domain-containing phosphohydrolase [Nocardia abscessus]